ncbi:MAG: ribosome biogenesis protein [Candidatus Thorarchaeota archaeon]|nr:MAG: ribosome biogenesis protein [Candidatus Thorarchaeota archaeon]
MVSIQGTGPLKVVIFHADQCDPKKCTGIRLGQMKRAILVRDLRKIPERAVVLNPVSEVALSPSDRETVRRAGIVALDCSWNQAEEIFSEAKSGVQRALPYLLAANPVNTYKPIRLSTAEAIGAALYILGFKEAARDIMSVFRWGPTFITLNREWLDAYAECVTSTEVVTVQQEIMAAHTKAQSDERDNSDGQDPVL